MGGGEGERGEGGGGDNSQPAATPCGQGARGTISLQSGVQGLHRLLPVCLPLLEDGNFETFSIIIRTEFETIRVRQVH